MGGGCGMGGGRGMGRGMGTGLGSQSALAGVAISALTGTKASRPAPAAGRFFSRADLSMGPPNNGRRVLVERPARK